MSAPAHSPDLSEPQTPMWLPALGALFFAGAFVYWATLPSAPTGSADAAASAASAAAAAPTGTPSPAASTAPSPVALRPAPVAGAGTAAATASGAASGRRPALDPARAAEVQRMLNRLPKSAQH
jgi:hypothetical protein